MTHRVPRRERIGCACVCRQSRLTSEISESGCRSNSTLPIAPLRIPVSMVPTPPALPVLVVDETQLVQRLLARDEHALCLLYRRYGPSLLYAIRRLVRDQAQAEDILQEGLLRIWLHIGRYDVSRGRLFTWMQRICCYHAIDVLRSATHHLHTRGQSLDTDAARYLPAPTTFHPEHIGVLELTLRLSPAHRELIELVYFQGYTYVEAAQHLGLPLGTAKTRARAALLALSKLAR
ncbi:RNA polymerase sigma factor [Hymenobacter sp. HD11105]